MIGMQINVKDRKRDETLALFVETLMGSPSDNQLAPSKDGNVSYCARCTDFIV